MRLIRGEPRADCHVAPTRAHTLEQPVKLGRRMLTVRVDAAAVSESVLLRVGETGRDRSAETAVFPKAEDPSIVRPRQLGGAVGRAVIDDEDIRVWHLRL